VEPSENGRSRMARVNHFEIPADNPERAVEQVTDYRPDGVSAAEDSYVGQGRVGEGRTKLDVRC
jgi:hypothetical protein